MLIKFINSNKLTVVIHKINKRHGVKFLALHGVFYALNTIYNNSKKNNCHKKEEVIII